MLVEARRLASQYFLPTLLVVAIIAMVTALEVLGPIASIKSGYLFLGVLFASVVYYVHEETPPKQVPTGRGVAPYYGQVVLGVVALVVGAVAAAAMLPFADPTAVRTGALVIGLPVGYTVLVFQVGEQAPSDWLLTQILALFALDPITKVLSTDFYFGRGDIPKHVRFTELVTTTGTWRNIPETTFYHFFPGLQTLVGSVSLLSGLSEYDSLVTTGIVTYLIVVVAAYLLADLLFDDWLLPVCVALGVTVLGPIHRYSVYFFPQSLSVGLVLVVILAAYRFDVVSKGGYGKHLLVAFPIVVALWFTHHLTTVLFAPVVLCLVAVPVIAERCGFDGVRRLKILSLGVWIGGSVAYWLLGGVFVQSLISAVRMVLTQGRVSDTDAGAPIVSLGAAVPEPLVNEAVLSLLSVGAVYNVTLVCVFSLSALLLLRDPNRYRSSAAILTVGLLGTGVMIRTPIDVHGLARTQLVVSVFVAFLVAVTFHRILPLSVGSIKKTGPALLLVLLVATSGAAHAADDLYGLHSGPDLWETRTTPETQKEFSTAEMEGFHLAASFADRNDLRLGTDWNSEIGLSRYRYGLPTGSFAVEDGRITTDRDVVLYRQRWVDHSVRLVPERRSFVTLLVSDGWFDRMVGTENKVYTTGNIGMIGDNPNATYVEMTGRP